MKEIKKTNVKKFAAIGDLFRQKNNSYNVQFIGQPSGGKSVFTQEYMNAIRNLENGVNNTIPTLHLESQRQRGKRK